MRADFSLDYDVLTVERPQKLYLMARFEAGESPSEQYRRPLNLSLVIDRSGSMAGEKIDYTKQAAQFLVQHLGTQDVFSVVLYNDRVETLLEPQQITNKDRLSQQLDQIRVRGTTNLSGGWLQGCEHVRAGLGEDTLNRVLLMSDGLANRGVTDSKRLVQMARQKYEGGVSTTTMGLGQDFNEDLLMDIASGGGGAYYFIESPEVTPEIFQEELRGLLNVVGQNLNITVEQTAHVSGVRQLNAYPQEDDTFRLGDIFGSEVKTLVLELSIPELHTIGQTQIATLHFTYDEVTADGTRHQEKTMPVMVNVRPEGSSLPMPNKEVAESVLLLRAAQARKEAVQAADKGDYENAAQVLDEVAADIDNANSDNPQLREEQAALDEQSKKMKRGASGYDDYSRKTMQTQAFYTMTDRHNETMVLRFREQKRGAGDADAANKKKSTMETEMPGEWVVPEPASIARQPGVMPTHVTWQAQTTALTGDMIRIGRSSHNEVVVNARGVSRFHAQLRRENGQLLLQDVGSTNGTSLNNEPIEGEATLSVGDVVHLGSEKLVFHLDDKAAANAPDSLPDLPNIDD